MNAEAPRRRRLLDWMALAFITAAVGCLAAAGVRWASGESGRTLGYWALVFVMLWVFSWAGAGYVAKVDASTGVTFFSRWRVIAITACVGAYEVARLIYELTGSTEVTWGLAALVTVAIFIYQSRRLATDDGHPSDVVSIRRGAGYALALIEETDGQQFQVATFGGDTLGRPDSFFAAEIEGLAARHGVHRYTLDREQFEEWEPRRIGPYRGRPLG